MTAPTPTVLGRLYASRPGPWELTYNGLLIGDQSDIMLNKISGLREMPPLRTADQPKPRAHGAFGGRNYYGERIVQADLLVQAPQNDFETVLRALGTGFANITDPAGALPLKFQLGTWDNPRQLYCRPTKGGVPVELNYSYRKAVIPVELTAGDPLIYDTVQQSVSVGLPSPTAGLTFPTGFNVAFGASTGGSLQIANAGNEATPPVFTFNGPLTWPQVTLGSAFLSFQVTLGAGDTLVVDCGAGTAILNGTASRGNTIATGSTYFWLPPGGTSTIGFSSVDATQVTGTVTCTASSAWGWY